MEESSNLLPVYGSSPHNIGRDDALILWNSNSGLRWMSWELLHQTVNASNVDANMYGIYGLVSVGLKVTVINFRTEISVTRSLIDKVLLLLEISVPDGKVVVGLLDSTPKKMLSNIVKRFMNEDAAGH